MNRKRTEEELIFIKTCLTGQNFKKLLRQKSMTKWALSKATKISRQTFYNWIHNVTQPTDEGALAVAKYLGLIKPNRAERLALMKELHTLEEKIERLGA